MKKCSRVVELEASYAFVYCAMALCFNILERRCRCFYERKNIFTSFRSCHVFACRARALSKVHFYIASKVDTGSWLSKPTTLRILINICVSGQNHRASIGVIQKHVCVCLTNDSASASRTSPAHARVQTIAFHVNYLFSLLFPRTRRHNLPKHTLNHQQTHSHPPANTQIVNVFDNISRFVQFTDPSRPLRFHVSHAHAR